MEPIQIKITREREGILLLVNQGETVITLWTTEMDIERTDTDAAVWLTHLEHQMKETP